MSFLHKILSVVAIKQNYSVVFHWVVGALKRDQSESLEKFPKYTEKFPDSFNRGLKGQSEKFSDGLESCQTAWKVSRWSGQFPDGLDSFQIAWTVSRWPGMFPDSLECVQMACKVSRWSGNFLCFTKTFQVYKNFPGSIATLLPWFFRLCNPIHPSIHL